MSREISFWDIVFHFAMLVLAIWTILKSTGYINTPVWLEYGIPLSGVIFSFLAFYHSIIGIVFKIKDELSSMKIDIAKINVKLDHHDKDLESINKDLHFIKKRVVA